ncbi:hypothetical protein CN399_08865 [Bacillus cereus]|jgi:hypothetical protein|uniref:DUF3846 domain-containing protein n=1 Tax=Bacillus cereus TaxID=1396 RepID=UPI000BF75CE4|nr:DUF3846 domain-containing protein [Bacillus cereus]PFB17058.1 hypothetical protein CN399_08865 [Bacillus cereus]
MKNYIRVVLVEAGNPEIKIIEKWEHTLDTVQQFVGGMIQPIRVNSSVTLWMNEEGKMQQLEPNFNLLNKEGVPVDTVVGNVIIAGTNSEGDDVSLTDEEIELLQERFINRHMFQL